ncbi:MAG: hypothetical protein IKO49_06040 [Bacilli bacterium]|nr:hypothetical protein [Bacilli bacterium]
MKFDPSWFKTIPGLLITGGVVLLIVALVIFIVTSKKNKKEKQPTKDENIAQNTNTTAEVENNSAMTQDMNVAVQEPVMAAPAETLIQDLQAPITEVSTEIQQPIEVPTNVDIQQPIEVPTNVNIQQPIEIPTAVETQVTPVETLPQIESIPTQAPVEVPSAPQTEIPTVTPVAPTIDITPVEAESVTVVEPVAPTIPTTEVNNEVSQPSAPAIYGGVSEIIPNINLEPTNTTHQIYGGADPLENTQTLKPVSSTIIPTVEPSEPTIPSVEVQPEPTPSVIPTVQQQEMPSPIPTVTTQDPTSVIPPQL